MVFLLLLLIVLCFSCGWWCGGMVLLILVIFIIGIVLGVVVLIVGFSVMNGFECELNNCVLVVVLYGEIEFVNQLWNNWQEVLVKVQKVKGIVVVVFYINFIGLVESGSNMCVIQVKGVDLQQESQFSVLFIFVQNNVWVGFKVGEQQVILGKGVVDVLYVKQGDWVLIMIFNVDVDYQLLQLKCVRLYVIGILQLSGQFDYSFVMILMQDVQQYLEMGSSVIGIVIKVIDVFYVNKLVCDVGEVINSYVYIKSWIGIYGYMYCDIQMICVIMYLVMVLVIGVVCFNIVLMLVMVVKDKSGDIVVLCMFGVKDGLICVIFVWYGLLVGLVGSLFGVVIGVICVLNLMLIINGIEYLIGYKFFFGDIYFIDFLLLELYWLDVFYVLVIVLLLSLLVSWYFVCCVSCIDLVRVLSGQ